MKILSVTQLKPIQVRENGYIFPLNSFTRIDLDRRNRKIKCHELVFQRGKTYGTVGDMCEYLNNEDLLRLEEKGMISIKKANML